MPLTASLPRPKQTAVCFGLDHNTFPYAYRIFRKKLAGFCVATIGTTVAPLSAALKSHVRVEPTVKAFEELNDKLDPDKDLVTLGISCESCHFGGREHAKFQEKIRFLPTSEHIRLKPRDPNRPLLNSRDNASTVWASVSSVTAEAAPCSPTGREWRIRVKDWICGWVFVPAN